MGTVWTPKSSPAHNAAGGAWRGLLVLGYALIGGLNFPGQVPFDTTTALWEGRTHVRMSWGPRMFSAILGFFDGIVPGAGLVTAASMTLTALAWAALPVVRRRIAW